VKKKGKKTDLVATIGMTYCELCQEWVEEPMAVCEYRGRYGLLTIVNEGWPDRKPKEPNIHRLAIAIKALSYYQRTHGDQAAGEALTQIMGGDSEKK
jgi:hypothetical protein